METELADRLVSLRIGAPSKRKGTANYHVLYNGCNVGFKSLVLEEAREKTRNLLQIEARLVRNDLAHVLSYLFSPNSNSKLVSLFCAQKDYSREVLEPVHQDGIVRESSAYCSFSKDGSVLYRPVRRDTGKSNGFHRVTDIVYLEQENEQQIQSVGHLALVLHSFASFSFSNQECIDCIVQGLLSARVHVIGAAAPSVQSDILRKIVFATETPVAGQLLRYA